MYPQASPRKSSIQPSHAAKKPALSRRLPFGQRPRLVAGPQMIEPEIEPSRNLAAVGGDDVAQLGQILAALIVIDPRDVARGDPAQQPALDDAILVRHQHRVAGPQRPHPAKARDRRRAQIVEVNRPLEQIGQEVQVHERAEEEQRLAPGRRHGDRRGHVERTPCDRQRWAHATLRPVPPWGPG